MKVELFLEDPIGAGCGCSISVRDRMELVKRVREEAAIWDKVKRGEGEYTRELLSRVPEDKYPDYLRNTVDSGAQLPYIFVDGALVHSGSYPDLESFKKLVGGVNQKA